MLFSQMTLPSGYHRWSFLAFRFCELDFITFGLEGYLIPVKDFPEADPVARMEAHMVHKEAIAGNMSESEKVRRRRESRKMRYQAS